ncbi:hypothetical protein [Photorhabdus bodei]|uniref:Uncharacterized protein n=1 Tax=Photorhabdus bodei TaxID=2029681 RepID=A0ABX0AQ69_9GAMM|nr:hypothetical protein [Photorhabdus bodei]NDK99841.1 hypothetical protein [Photorhabdus bodei]NDL04033.1 hypothetical protein [Photorhabdus bodei]NDL08022.1 hypothetical protein [Photorhabdus bodei]
MFYTLWISRCIATAREQIPGSIANYVTGVSERSQQRGNLKDNRYICLLPVAAFWITDTNIAACMEHTIKIKYHSHIG